jgi:hypothetical protein
MQRQPLKVEAVLVQCVPVNEDDSQFSPWGRGVCLLDLDVKLDSVVASNRMHWTTKLAEPQTTARRHTATEPATDHHTFGSQSSGCTYRRRNERNTSHASTLRRVHDTALPTYRGATREPTLVTIS